MMEMSEANTKQIMNIFFYRLPFKLQFRISEMNPVTIPEDIFHKVMLYNSHPVADLFKEAVKNKIEELNETQLGDYEFGGEDYTRGDYQSFAFYYFYNPESELEIKTQIYYYAHMGEMWVNTLNYTLNSGVKVYVFNAYLNFEFNLKHLRL